jgi:two-component system KDP operon response regulator KdpE
MTSAPRVLVVDDEPQIVRGLKIILRDAGYDVEAAETKAQALAAVGTRPPEAVVLDLKLPDGEGIEVCREVRRFSRLPILVLSAVGDEREKIRALDAGADDYVTKPFGTGELLARLRAVLRRSIDAGGDSRLEIGELVIDVLDRKVTRAGTEIHLTPIEFDLVRVLAQQHGRLVTHRQLLQEVWGPEYRQETHYLRVHVAHIRAKLELDPSRPRYLITEPGVGYRLVEGADSGEGLGSPGARVVNDSIEGVAIDTRPVQFGTRRHSRVTYSREALRILCHMRALSVKAPLRPAPAPFDAVVRTRPASTPQVPPYELGGAEALRLEAIWSSSEDGLVPPRTRSRGRVYISLEGPAQPGTTVVDPTKPAARTSSITVAL